MNLFMNARGWLAGGLRRLMGVQIAWPGTRTLPTAKPVTFDTAMQVSAFWACARLITETVSSLPVIVYKKTGNKRRADHSHPLYRILALKPNRYQTRIDFFSTLVLNLVMWGNAYCHIVRNSSGQIISLLPLMSSQMEVHLLEDGSLAYHYTHSKGLTVYAEKSIWHIKLLGNGIIGLSPLGHAANSIGLAIAAENRVTAVYQSGAKPTGVLMLDKAISPAQREEIRKNFRDLAEGNNDSLMILERHMKYQPVSMSPQDIELLQSRKFQNEDIARFMGVPGVLINDTSGSTAWGSGIAQIIEGWYKLGLRPYLENIELSALLHLFPVEQQEDWEIELDFDALLRADMIARYDAHGKAVNNGLLTPNEARDNEGLEPLPGGDTLMINSALIPITQAGQLRQIIDRKSE